MGAPVGIFEGTMPDLAPTICRQRLVIEGTCHRPISGAAVRGYLVELSTVCDMTALIEPVTHRSDRYGWAGWIHWEASGAHVYAWNAPELFFSVDIYTCKPFDVPSVIEFTDRFFDARRVVAKTF